MNQEGLTGEKNKTSAPANLVHSVDASLEFILLVCHGRSCFPAGTKSDGVLWEELRSDQTEIIMYPLITVHDAFACHASNAADLKG